MEGLSKKEICKEMGHGFLIHVGSSGDGLEEIYVCVECGETLTSLTDPETIDVNKK